MVHTEDSAHFFSHSAAGERSPWDFLLAVLRFIAKAAAAPSLIDGTAILDLRDFSHKYGNCEGAGGSASPCERFASGVSPRRRPPAEAALARAQRALIGNVEQLKAGAE